MGITDAAIVTLIGAADSFTLSTMPAADTTKDVLTDYAVPVEMTATGELVGGKPHILPSWRSRETAPCPGACTGRIGTHFARAYLLPEP